VTKINKEKPSKIN